MAAKKNHLYYYIISSLNLGHSPGTSNNTIFVIAFMLPPRRQELLSFSERMYPVVLMLYPLTQEVKYTVIYLAWNAAAILSFFSPSSQISWL